LNSKIIYFGLHSIRLRIDRAERLKQMREMRLNLEQNWMNSYKEKLDRDADERMHRAAHDGALVHEQCDKYRRCAQCKRDLKNCGETNVWCDTRYIPGTRFIQ
jgi:hypothetical protein